jgi:formylglycine-generating enzyme required for sulfatase activity
MAGWVLVDLLGVTGFGEVWLAEQVDQPDRRTVLKFCRCPRGAVLPGLEQMGRQPGIVPLRRFHGGETCCLMYEHVPAGNLASYLGEWEEVMLEERVVRATKIVRRLAQIMAALHRLDPPLVHGNLKPANILVQRQDRGLVFSVAELGSGALSARWSLDESRWKALEGERLLARARGSYTPLYASVRQKLGSAPEPGDDVHALGVIWYQLVMGDLGAAPGKDCASQLIERGMKRNAVALLLACLEAGRQQPRDAVELEARLKALGTHTEGAARGSASVPAPRVAGAGELPRPATSSARPLPGDVLVVDLGEGMELRLAYIPSGTFLMGSPEDEEGRRDDEGPRHVVSISRGFYLAVWPITQAQWRAVMGCNPSRFRDDDRPVESVSWNDCIAFCRKLRERTGGRYRLPTEAEWEYACRAGTMTPFSFGDTLSAEQANYYAEQSYGDGEPGVYREETTLVGSFPPNAWGLYDMHGNVYEWCSDWYDKDYYDRGEEEDPEGPRKGTARVIRGGAWSECPAFCRSACRDKCAQDYRVALIGCRVVLCVGV